MNPWRVAADRVARRQQAGPTWQCMSCGWTRPAPEVFDPRWLARIESDHRQVCPARLTDHERLMRHTGRPECPIHEHTDALRRLGRTVMERDEARAEADLWMHRALRAEARLRHPSGGQQAA